MGDVHLRPTVGLQDRISRWLGVPAGPTLLSEFRILPAQLNLNLPYHLEQEPRTLLPTEPPEDARTPQGGVAAGSDVGWE